MQIGTARRTGGGEKIQELAQSFGTRVDYR